MDDYAELEISLASLDANQCQVQMRYRPPQSQSEIRLGVLNDASATPVINLGGLGDKLEDGDAYARALTDAVFSNSLLRQSFAESLTAAASSNSTLRIRLWIDSGSSVFHDVCWEMLLNPQDGTRLSAGERILFSRGLSTLAAAPLSLNPVEDATALLVVASPSDLVRYKLAPIDVDRELERARANLAGLSAIRSLPDGKGLRATFDDLFAAITPQVDVLYLVCHGSLAGEDAWLWLEDDAGKSRRVSATEFVKRLRGLPSFPELVVLMSCQSAGGKAGSAWRALGPRLVNAGVPVVLAMQANFSMQSEAVFVPRFFQSLREHGEADRALSFARAFIAGQPDWWVPAIFSHLRETRIFGQSNPAAAPVLTVKPFEPETVYVPSGSFLMGTDEPEAPGFEKPAHRVELPAFRIGKYPVTNRQFVEFIRQTRRIVPPEMGWSGQNPPADRLDHPVQGVTWYEALDYCAWLSGKTGRVYRLPNEAEWEKAARGTDGRRYPWGDTWDENRCVSTNQVRAVNAFQAQSTYGCYDLVGNVREWTLSLWGLNRMEPDPGCLYPWQPDQRNDPAASKLTRRVIRGAGLNEAPESLTCFARSAYVPDKSGPPGKRHGFRVLMEI